MSYFSLYTIELDQFRSRSNINNAKLDKIKVIRKCGQINE